MNSQLLDTTEATTSTPARTTFLMYSLYDCDAWRSSESMSLEYETLDRQTMNDKIKEIVEEYFADEVADHGIDPESDDLVELTKQQAIDYLHLVVREINLTDKTVEEV